MRKDMLFKIILIAILAGIALAAAILSNKFRGTTAQPANIKNTTVYNEAADIEVAATLLDGPNSQSENTRIEIVLTTHQGDLSTFDMTTASQIEDSSGVKTATLKWEETSPGSHHRSGVLIFPKVKEFDKLIIKGLGDEPERVLQWQ